MNPDTNRYKVQTEYIPKVRMAPAGVMPIALDIGYSGTKGVSPAATFRFPSFVTREVGTMIGDPKPNDILYRDETGTYLVGDSALSMLRAYDTNDSAGTLYSRNRYFTPEFKILARIGIAMGLPGARENGWDEPMPIILQTGLPPAYKATDSNLLVEALAGEHKFQARFGAAPWVDFKFSLSGKTIRITDQPMGSVYAASKTDDMESVVGKNGRPYINNRVLIIDGGFGTLDVFAVEERRITSVNTFDNLGMKEVFKRTVRDIQREIGAEVHVHTLQNLLETGNVTVFDRKTRTRNTYSFEAILKRNCEAVCTEAMDKLDAQYNYLQGFDYLLITGGTCAAWLPLIQERFGNSGIEIITGNQNDTALDHVYSNARGYYMMLLGRLLSPAK